MDYDELIRDLKNGWSKRGKQAAQAIERLIRDNDELRSEAERLRRLETEREKGYREF